MKISCKIAPLLAAALLPACNDQKPAAVPPTPAPGGGNAPTTAGPAQNPAGGTTGGAAGKFPAESAKTYPPTEQVK